MIEAIKDNWWHQEPDEPAFAWKGKSPYCLKENGDNTGLYGYQTLEQYDVETGELTGNTKPNVSTDSDYIAPIQDLNNCPLPEPTYIWEGYQPYCITEEEYELGWRGIDPTCLTDSNGDNQGYYLYDTLEQYEIETGNATGVTKPNVFEDPDYISPIRDTTMCPITDTNPDPVIDEDTNIFIVFDASGSMQTTLNPLQEMRDNTNYLKSKLLNFYGTGQEAEDKYNEKVKVFSNKSEGTWIYLDIYENMYGNISGDVIMLVFQDEASMRTHVNGYIYNFDINQNRTEDHEQDIASLRQRINNNPNNFKQVVFQVYSDYREENAPKAHLDAFKPYLQAIENGQGLYSGSYGLKDKPQVKYKYDITAGDSAQYYTDKVVEALNEFGYNI